MAAGMEGIEGQSYTGYHHDSQTATISALVLLY